MPPCILSMALPFTSVMVSPSTLTIMPLTVAPEGSSLILFEPQVRVIPEASILILLPPTFNSILLVSIVDEFPPTLHSIFLDASRLLDPLLSLVVRSPLSNVSLLSPSLSVNSQLPFFNKVVCFPLSRVIGRLS